jgi:hypothetical protein
MEPIYDLWNTTSQASYSAEYIAPTQKKSWSVYVSILSTEELMYRRYM